MQHKSNDFQSSILAAPAIETLSHPKIFAAAEATGPKRQIIKGLQINFHQNYPTRDNIRQARMWKLLPKETS